MNWKIMLSCKLLHFRIKLFLLILIFNEIANEETTVSNSTQITIEAQAMHMKDDKNARQLNFNNITIEGDYDPDYPYEKLLELVKETKRILSSTNATVDKRMLNLNPFDYQIYLRSTDVDNHLNQTDTPDLLKPDVKITILNRGPPEDSATAMCTCSIIVNTKSHSSCIIDYFFIGSSHSRPESSNMGACDIVSETHKPKHLKSIDGTNQFIINLDNQFVQTWNTVKCLSPDKQCGIRSILPEMYDSVCEQNYSGTAKFFSVPVSKEITLSKQENRQFRIPIGCNCKLRMATNTRQH